jgi:hypothetical protein
MTIAITRRELGAGELRREAARCRDAAASRRMLALALVLVLVLVLVLEGGRIHG